MSSMDDIKRVVLHVAVVGVAVGLLYFVRPPCPVHVLTGWNCPGCGTTRALHQLAHGHLWAAFRLNPLTFVMLPALGLLWRTAGARPAWLWSLVVVLVVFGVMRNFPGPPFALFALQP